MKPSRLLKEIVAAFIATSVFASLAFADYRPNVPTETRRDHDERDHGGHHGGGHGGGGYYPPPRPYPRPYPGPYPRPYPPNYPPPYPYPRPNPPPPPPPYYPPQDQYLTRTYNYWFQGNSVIDLTQDLNLYGYQGYQVLEVIVTAQSQDYNASAEVLVNGYNASQVFNIGTNYQQTYRFAIRGPNQIGYNVNSVQLALYGQIFVSQVQVRLYR